MKKRLTGFAVIQLDENLDAEPAFNGLSGSPRPANITRGRRHWRRISILTLKRRSLSTESFHCDAGASSGLWVPHCQLKPYVSVCGRLCSPGLSGQALG